MSLDFLFIGHRGTRTNFDENTIEAFQIALDSGANYIEFDIRELKDGNLVVFHDSSLERITNESGLIRDYDSLNIMNLVTKKRMCKIPFLIQVLERFKNKISFMIEMKEAELWEVTVNILAKENLLNQTIFSGKDLSLLQKVKKKVPQTKVCYNITKGLDISIQNFLESQNLDKLDFIPDMISLRSALVGKKFIEKCHKYEILALSWDFINYKHPVEKIKHLINLGIDGILFDDYHNINVIKEYLSSL